MARIIIKRLINLLTKLNNKLSNKGFKNYRIANSVEDIRLTESIYLITPGRSGTKALIDFCANYTDIYCEHAPAPWLASIGYQYHQGIIGAEGAQYSFYACREQYLKKAFQQGRAFMDGDCKNLPLLPEIAKFLPNSKFIHIVRHPEKFIRSGLARGYYNSLSPELWGHLESNKKDDSHTLKSQIQKIAFFWNEANLIAEKMKQTLGIERVATLLAEDMFRNPKTIITTLSLLDISLNVKQAKNYKIRLLNQQKSGHVNSIETDALIKEVIATHCPTRLLYYSN